jgi:23S rRNA pseudouridine2605 synthase
MSVGRLDLNSEGLLLLTNDGELKRRLELPSTGWLRKYRVRVKGNPVDPDLEPLRKGITVEGERFQPMIVSLDRVQGANAWLTVGLREGKNREIRRAMTAIGLTVNRLIRVSYGPFRLGDMEPGDVEEVRGKTLRDQLGLPPASEDMTGTAKSKLTRARPGGTAAKPPRAPSGTPVAKSARAEAPSDRPPQKPARSLAPRPGAVRVTSAGPEAGTTPRPKPKAARPLSTRNSGPAGSPPKNPPRRGK